MIAAGQGGAITSRKWEVVKKVRNLKNNVLLKNSPRYSFYFTDIQSAIGLTQLKKLKNFIVKRKEVANTYTQAFTKLSVKLPKIYPGREHIFYRFMLGSTKVMPKPAMNYALKKGVKIKQVVPLLHRELGLSGDGFSIAEAALKEWVSVPIYPSLKDTDIQRIIRLIKEIYG
jgi:dTDP-4-amino-4,6-dideoxygalactose transaminase